MNPVVEYYSKILDGSIVTSRKVKAAYTELVENIYRNEDSEWEYSKERANHALDFIENFCKHSKGSMAGKPFILELWQKAFVAAIFGTVDKITGERKFQEAILIVARKNGKSTLASAIGLYMMIADGELGPEIYSVATKKDQSKIIWLEAKRMVKKSKALNKRIKGLVSEMVADMNDAVFKPLGRDSDTLDGLNVHAALFDKLCPKQ